MWTSLFKTVFWTMSMYHGIHDVHIVHRCLAQGRMDYFFLSMVLYGASVGAMAFWLQNKTVSMTHRLFYLPAGILHLVDHNGWKQFALATLFSFTVDNVFVVVYLYLMMVHYQETISDPDFPIAWTRLWYWASCLSVIQVQPWNQPHSFFEKALIAVLPAHLVVHCLSRC